MKALKNAKHEAVAQAFVADPARIGWRAYVKVYPHSSQRAAETGFSRLLKIAEFTARIEALQAPAVAAVGLTAKRVLDELDAIGFGNIQDTVHITVSDNVVADVQALTRSQAAAIGELTVETYLEGRGKDAREVKRIKMKLAPKTPALQLLGQHLKLFTEKHELSGPDGGPVKTENLSELELARRIAFALEQGARAASRKPAKAARKRKSKE